MRQLFGELLLKSIITQFVQTRMIKTLGPDLYLQTSSKRCLIAVADPAAG